MKTFRIATTHNSIDIKMPTFLFWLFKKFAVISVTPPSGLQGISMDVILFDEAVEDK